MAGKLLMLPAIQPLCVACGSTVVAVRSLAGDWFCKGCMWMAKSQWCPTCQRTKPHVVADHPDLVLLTCLHCKTTYEWADGGQPRVWCDGS